VESGSSWRPDRVLARRGVDRLRAILEQTGETHGRLRIEVTGSEREPAYVLSIADSASGDDVALDFLHIILLDPESRRRLRGQEMDYRDDADGERLPGAPRRGSRIRDRTARCTASFA